MDIRVPAGFTLNELQAQLRSESAEIADGFFTLGEWANHFGVPRSRMRDILLKAKAAGILKVSHIQRERVDGRLAMVPVYAFEIKRGGKRKKSGD